MLPGSPGAFTWLATDPSGEEGPEEDEAAEPAGGEQTEIVEEAGGSRLLFQSWRCSKLGAASEGSVGSG